MLAEKLLYLPKLNNWLITESSRNIVNFAKTHYQYFSDA